MKSRKDGVWTSSAIGLGAAMLATAVTNGQAVAQTASPSQTPPGPNAIEQTQPTHFAFPPAQGLMAPAGAEAVHFTLSAIDVDGQFDDVRAHSDALARPLIGQNVSVADVYGFAAKLQQAYFDAGYPLARVVVPPQELGSDGRVRIRVVDGFVENVDVSQLPKRTQARVHLVLAPLIGEHHVSKAMLERRLLLAGDVAGISLTTALAPGDQTGATVLVLSGTHHLVSAVFAVDNRVSKQLGRWQATASVAANSLFGHGERIYATLAGFPERNLISDTAKRRYYSVGVDTPIGADGLEANVSYDYSSTRPGDDIAWERLSGEYSRLDLSLAYPLLRSRAANVRVTAALDIAEDRQSTHILGPDITLSLDEIRALRLGLSGDATLFNESHVSYGATLSHGLDMLGARTEADAYPLKPLSRQGANAVFTSLEAEFNFAQPFGDHSLLAISARGQTNFHDPLLRSEQFSPSGWDGLSGPPPGLLVGDSGYVSRLQLEHSLLTQGATITPYVFGFNSHVNLEKPTALELPNTRAEGAGIGIRLGLGDDDHGGRQWSIVGELSDTDSNDSTVHGNWLTVGIVRRF